ncbi:hypothetical protein EGI22_22930 [Lacihabitans sp. LS3-19]|uniref:hypothetical protein n=1 Tax=Lacihabitans sp. LS3-19 TaxID=2487335 RepID=UPI0020CD3354|nr:hypothetical protein [Lacihabitans sp. LS3-19]MCP9770769.1 hypothetical protein [Lacihabitans sp. LS3-19]
MKNFQFLLLLSSVIFMISCSSKTESESSNSLSETVASTNADCVFSYIDKYDQLLPLETIQKHYKGDMSSAKMKYQVSKDAISQKRDTYVYTWNSDRTKIMEFGGTKMNLPIPNEIGIKWLGDDLYKIMDRGNPVSSFKAFYHTPTKEELDMALNKAEEKVSEDKNVTEETKNSAMGMAKGLAAGAKYDDVDGLGDAASWDFRDNALIILIGDKTFKVVASVSADSEVNKDLAIELAKEILAKCK